VPYGRVILAIDGLSPAAPGLYEGWLQVDGSPISFGRFDVTADGKLVDPFGDDVDPRGFRVTAAIDRVEAVFITLEPPADRDADPSTGVVLAGPVHGEARDVALTVTDAVGAALGTARGRFMLRTPTSAATDDESRGVWFGDAGGAPLLELPLLPAGWRYEGWVLRGDAAFPTGRFAAPDGPDEDGAGDQGGAEPPPSLPGQDWLDEGPGRLTEGDARVVVSVEPDGRPYPARPFLIVLESTVSGSTGLERHPLPSGSIHLISDRPPTSRESR